MRLFILFSYDSKVSLFSLHYQMLLLVYLYPLCLLILLDLPILYLPFENIRLYFCLSYLLFFFLCFSNYFRVLFLSALLSDEFLSTCLSWQQWACKTELLPLHTKIPHVLWKSLPSLHCSPLPTISFSLGPIIYIYISSLGVPAFFLHRVDCYVRVS